MRFACSECSACSIIDVESVREESEVEDAMLTPAELMLPIHLGKQEEEDYLQADTRAPQGWRLWKCADGGRATLKRKRGTKCRTCVSGSIDR